MHLFNEEEGWHYMFILSKMRKTKAIVVIISMFLNGKPSTKIFKDFYSSVRSYHFGVCEVYLHFNKKKNTALLAHTL